MPIPVLNHAYGDGKVEIVDVNPERKRIGTSEHAEYYTDEAKVILTGGEPHLTTPSVETPPEPS